MIVNETVLITIEGDGRSVSYTIPAFTQEAQKVGETVTKHLGDYLLNSLDHEKPMSVGDFVLWLIRKASETEPRKTAYV